MSSEAAVHTVRRDRKNAAVRYEQEPSQGAAAGAGARENLLTSLWLLVIILKLRNRLKKTMRKAADLVDFIEKI